MARFRLQTFKQIGSGKVWSNAYNCVAADFPSAQVIGDAIIAAERNVHLNTVSFIYYRITITEPHDGEFTNVPVNLQGLGGTGDYLPVFNTIRCDFAVALGRPSRHYIRRPIREDEQSGGGLQSDVRAALLSAYVDVLVALSVPTDNFLCDESGHHFISGSVYAFVTMRSTTRRRRKKVTPTP